MSGHSVIADLALWGPQSVAAPLSLVEAQQYCRRLATSHYENFPVVSWLLPRHLHQHFYNIYAYCRWADDLGDETGDRSRSCELLRWWDSLLDECYNGHVSHPVFVALLPTIRRFQIPHQPFADLISAFQQDQVVLSYDTMDQLLDYCRRSANPVGRIVLALAETVSEENFTYSDSVCTGLQLANFWQDVARDYKIGRIYLPRDRRLKFQYSDEELGTQRTTAPFQAMMKELVAEARTMLLAGRPLVKQMPGRIRLDVEMFIRGGLLILREIEKSDYRVWEQRPKVKKSQFFFELMKALCRLS